MAYPKPAEKIKLNDPMLGGKFRTKGFRGVISLLYLLFLSNSKKFTVEYSKIYAGDVAQLKDEIVSFINSYLGVNKTKNDYNDNYLISGQYESINTTLERIIRIGSLQFINNALPGGAERKTKKRYEKRIKFTTNMLVLDMIISSYDIKTIKNVLKHWLSNEAVSNIGKSQEDYLKCIELEKKIATYFTTLTQEGLYKIRQNGEIIFRPIGIYDVLLEGNTVSYEDEHEIVGTSSGYKNFVKEGLDPWLTMDGSSAITRKQDAIVGLADFAEMVRTQLDISYVSFETEKKEKQLDIDFIDTDLKHEQIIYFGAPGTGKSFKVEHRKGETEKDRIRTTFHPDSDYSSFVGCYKPMETGEGEDLRITYKFEGQCFAKAYVEAW